MRRAWFIKKCIHSTDSVVYSITEDEIALVAAGNQLLHFEFEIIQLSKFIKLLPNNWCNLHRL